MSRNPQDLIATGAQPSKTVRWLVGFAEVHAGAGERITVQVPIRGREFANYDGGWKYEAGTFELHAASSVSQVAATTSLVLN